MRSEEEIKTLKEVKEKLKECKDEWLESNSRGKPALGVLTVQQILDYATDGVTSWDFIVEEQWREEVNRYDKRSGSWVFDGYVFHVRGSLHIEGLGRRSQFGCKVGIGGKDNQNSAYKAASSDCLKKCASLFGVGSSIYSKIKIETDDQYNEIVNDPNYQVGNQQQWENNQQNNAVDYNNQQLNQQQQYQQQQQQPEQVTLPNGDIQQGEYIWSQQQQNWIHQSQYNQEQGGQYPRLTQEQQNTQWYYDTMQEFDPQGYQKMREEAGPSPMEQMQQGQHLQNGKSIEQTIAEVDQMFKDGTINQIDFPFENVPPKQEEKQEGQAQQQNFEAQPQQEAQPQAEAKQQDFQAVQYGAPVDSNTENKEEKKEEDPLAHVEVNNPWDTPENKEQIEIFRQHKERLGISNDKELLPHVREYFKDEKATAASITPETLQGFNTYLQNIQA